MTSDVKFSEKLARPAYAPPPTFVRIGNAEVALAKITKMEIRHFGFNELEDGRKYASRGSISIHLLNIEETLLEFGDKGYDLLQFFLDLYGIDDPSTEYSEGTIYP